ncbi:MAG: ParB/RepB/Spo0J family partition protein [Acidimicrobiia bacterium]|nr:ParB/RepB/Spo0J family partition protein [Acidimicrobiia bacterium]
MAARKSGLGRGLDALIPVELPDTGFASISVDSITANPQQPRTRFDDDALQTLADSIKEVGVLQPVVVRGHEDGGYTLVAGERRLRAARLVGLNEIPAVIRSASDSVSDLSEALIENIHREDLSALEEAAAYQQLLDDFELTHEQVAKRVGKSRASISNSLRLLQLPASIQGMLERGELAMGHARALLGCEDQAYANHIAAKASEEGWSVRQVEDAVRARSVMADDAKPPPVHEPRPAAIIELEGRLAERLGTPVAISYSAANKGKVVVKFSSLDDLERIYRSFLT